MPGSQTVNFRQRCQADAARLLVEARPELIARWPLPAADDQVASVLAWSERVAQENGLTQRLRHWQQRLGWLLTALAAVALAGGFATALTVLGDGSQAVNILWALGALLGFHLLMLLLWLAGLMLRSEGALLGRLVLWIQSRLGGRDDVLVLRAVTHQNTVAGVTQWWFGLLSHLLWLSALLGAVAGLLVALSLRSYHFVWETTILPDSVFYAAVQLLSWLPQSLGLTVPDADSVVRLADGLQSDSERRAWASWLTAMVLVYGVLLRLLMLILVLLRLRWLLARTPFNLQRPEWVTLLQRLAPFSRQEITDPAPPHEEALRIQVPLSGTASGTAVATPVLAILELADRAQGIPESDGAGYRVVDVNTRHQRQQVLESLQAAMPRRLLVCCDTTLSPDRGTWRWLVAAGSLAGETAACLLNSESADSERLASWQQGLADIGLQPSRQFTDVAKALVWLKEAP